MMGSISAFQSGLTGIQTGINNLNKNTAAIASGNSDETSGHLTESLIDLSANKQQVDASAKVIATANETIGTLLDITV